MTADDISTQRYALRPAVVVTVLEDGALLLNLETNYFYRLNSSGWAIAQLFENGASLQTVLDGCYARGSAPEDEAAVIAFIDSLFVDNLIGVNDGEPADDAHMKVTSSATDLNVDAGAARWTCPTIDRQREPLQKVITSAFDPSVPLLE